MIIKVLIACLILAAVVLLPVGLALLFKQDTEISFGSSCSLDDGESGNDGKACAACEIKDLVNCDYDEEQKTGYSGSVTAT